MFDDMKKHLPFITASVLCLPFCGLVVIYLVALAFKCADAAIPDVLTIPLVHGLFLLSVFPLFALPILALVSVSVVVAWLQKAKTRFEVLFAGIYSVVMLLHLGFAIWCLVTKPVWDL
jgi:branched-subunit amino acid permease